jgi:dihydrofolate reductase
MDRVDWNAELVRGDLGKAVQQLKRESGEGLFVGGVKLPQALAELGLIDEYELVVQPRLVGHGPTLFAGLSKYVDLKLVSNPNKCQRFFPAPTITRRCCALTLSPSRPGRWA